MAQAKMDFVINTKVDKTAFVELKREIQALQGLTEKDLINFGSANNFQEAKKQLAAIQSSATTVETALNKAFSPKLGTVSLSKFNNELKKIDLQQLANNFSKAGAAGNAAFRSLTTNVLTTKIHIKETHKLLDDMGKTMSNTIKWGLSSSAWNTMTGSFQKAYGYIKDLDRSLNNIRIVSGKSADDMARFAQQANNAAKVLGSKTTDYTDAALIYYQQGLNEDEVLKRTDATIKMANVLGASAEEVSNYMTAIWNNFDDGSKTVEYYADVLAKLGAATASSAEEISTGLEKFAAIADTVGLSYEYATAALTTVTATTRQSADVVGTAFKTLFARIQDLELGETLEDGVTLGKYSEALRAIGVNVLDAQGNLKDMNNILDDMGSKWDTLTDAQKVSLAQTVAGTRQYTQLVALMDNWDTFQNNLNLASNATGELNKQQKIYMESTQAHLDSLSTSAERLYKSLIDSEGLNDLIDTFSTLVTGVSEYTEAIGGSKSVLLQLGSVASKAFGRTISQGIATSIANFKKLKEQAEDFNAQAAIIQKFKGIQVNDEAFKELVAMAEAANKYKDTLSEAQVEEANALMSGYNEAVNARDLWQEAKTYAENYYRVITRQEVDSLDHTFSNEQLENYFKELDDKVVEYAQSLGASKKEINAVIADRSKSEIEAYISSATKLIENKLIKNEQVEVKLKSILEKYSKATALEDKNLLSEEEVKALAEFGQVYGEVSDEILKNVKKVKKTFTDAQKGASKSFNTAVDEAKGNWRSFIETIDIQAISQGFIDLTGQIMSIASAVESFVNIPNIWRNEDLTTGEKILQTMLAIGNVGKGVASTFQMIHTAADMVRAAQGKAVLSEAAHGAAIANATEKQKEQTEAVGKTTEAIEGENSAIGQSQTEINDKKRAILQEQKISADASAEEILDETTFANRVALSEEAIHRKNEALGKGRTDEQKQESKEFLQSMLGLSEQEQAKKLTEDFLKSHGYKGRINQLPTMSEQRLKSALRDHEDPELAKHISKTFKGIYGQAHGIARGERSGFDIRNKKGVQETVDFLNDWISKKDPIEEVAEGFDKAPDKIDKTNKSLKNLKNATGGDSGGGKSGGFLGSLKKDIDDIITGFLSIPAPVLGAAAAIAVVVAGIYLLAEAIETEKEKDERLQKQIDDSVEAYNKAAEAANELNSAISNYQSGIDGMQGLTKGTLEYYDAIVKANEAAQALIEKLGLIVGTDYTIGPDGLINIKEDVLTQHAKEAQKETHRAQAGVYSAKAQQVRESSTGIDKTV